LAAWPEDAIGVELEAKLYPEGGKLFARVTNNNEMCHGWNVLHGEAEFVRLVPETCNECGQEV
jgi:hypothetical protein